MGFRGRAFYHPSIGGVLALLLSTLLKGGRMTKKRKEERRISIYKYVCIYVEREVKGEGEGYILTMRTSTLYYAACL